MEKRLVYALVISLVFFMGYSFIVSKLYPPQPLQQPQQQKSIYSKEISSSQEAQSINNINFENKNKTDMPASAILAIPQDAELAQTQINNFIVTYSSQGGYIKKIVIAQDKYKDEIVFQNIGFIPEDKNKIYNIEVSQNKISFTYSEKKSSEVLRKDFIFDNYCLEIKLENFVFKNEQPILILSCPLLSNTMDGSYQEFFYSRQGLLQRNDFNKIKDSFYLNDVEFSGCRDRYYTASLVKSLYKVRWEKDKDNAYFYLLPQENKTLSQSFSLYIGPQKKEYLAPLGLNSIIHYGFFHAIGEILVKTLLFIHKITSNWGISIILLSILIYLILFPFTLKSTKAMKKMQDLQPEVNALKEKFKDNPQKLNKEIMDLYKNNKINPLGGCLPLLFQFPVLFALYQVFLRFTELKGASFLWIKDLSLPDRLFPLPFNIPFLGNYFNLLPIFILILSFLQQKYTSMGAAPEQKKMGIFFAILIGFIFYNFPACLVLYWLVQNILTLAYQVKVAKTK